MPKFRSELFWSTLGTKQNCDTQLAELQPKDIIEEVSEEDMSETKGHNSVVNLDINNPLSNKENTPEKSNITIGTPLNKKSELEMLE